MNLRTAGAGYANLSSTVHYANQEDPTPSSVERLKRSMAPPGENRHNRAPRCSSSTAHPLANQCRSKRLGTQFALRSGGCVLKIEQGEQPSWTHINTISVVDLLTHWKMSVISYLKTLWTESIKGSKDSRGGDGIKCSCCFSQGRRKMHKTIVTGGLSGGGRHPGT